MSASLEITQLRYRYPGESEAALRDLTLSLQVGEILAVVGPSGSGKSTLLRLLAGLARPDSGTLRLTNQVIADEQTHLPPHRRGIGMVSQAGDLFPHLSVERNIAYGLPRSDRGRKQERVRQLLDSVGLPGLEKRFPHELSGGEAQRVALARALAARPQLLLLDEPFSSLDRELRGRLRLLTTDLLRREHLTTLFVTHHGEDALTTGDRVAVLHRGKLVQLAPPQTIWAEPAAPEVAALFGGINRLTETEAAGRPLWARPEDLVLVASGQGFAEGTIERVEYRGACQEVSVSCGADRGPLVVCCSPEEALAVGRPTAIDWKKTAPPTQETA
ncbi:MAG: ABC transporter ATP-binding protein [Verrucomicrobiota bacterium]